MTTNAVITASNFSIQLISDIHLEMYNHGAPQFIQFVKKVPQADYLALLGDIGTPEDPLLGEFLQWCSQQWKFVFWIPGNHEYYNYSRGPFKDKKEKLLDLRAVVAPYPNVLLLHRNTYTIGNVRILGCTLWSHIPPQDERTALLYMADFRRIYVRGRNARPADFNHWHEKDMLWLTKQLEIAHNEKKMVLVLTHHIPSFQLIHPKYREYPINSCFATNLEHLFHSPLHGWFCGHTHTSQDQVIDGVHCCLNPYGYPTEHTGKRITKYYRIHADDTVVCTEESPDTLPCVQNESH